MVGVVGVGPARLLKRDESGRVAGQGLAAAQARSGVSLAGQHVKCTQSELALHSSGPLGEPGHWITWSARAKSNGGTVRPSALAVRTLITNSNVVGCVTGSSAGFAPFKILST
jgi:hypothetical protein